MGGGGGGVGLSGSHRTGRYGTQRKPFSLTLRRSRSLEEATSSSNPEESGEEGLLEKQKQSAPHCSRRKSGSEKDEEVAGTNNET